MHAKDITQKFKRIDARVDARMDARIDCRIDYRPFFRFSMCFLVFRRWRRGKAGLTDEVVELRKTQGHRHTGLVANVSNGIFSSSVLPFFCLSDSRNKTQANEIIENQS